LPGHSSHFIVGSEAILTCVVDLRARQSPSQHLAALRSRDSSLSRVSGTVSLQTATRASRVSGSIACMTLSCALELHRPLCIFRPSTPGLKICVNQEFPRKARPRINWLDRSGACRDFASCHAVCRAFDKLSSYLGVDVHIIC
jgi:hypothetical protein